MKLTPIWRRSPMKGRYYWYFKPFLPKLALKYIPKKHVNSIWVIFLKVWVSYHVWLEKQFKFILGLLITFSILLQFSQFLLRFVDDAVHFISYNNVFKTKRNRDKMSSKTLSLLLYKKKWFVSSLKDRRSCWNWNWKDYEKIYY